MPPRCHSATTFKENWFQKGEVKEWLACGVDQTTFGCKVCHKKDLSIKVMSFSALISHMKSKKHQAQMKSYEKNKKLFVTKRKLPTDSLPGSSSNTKLVKMVDSCSRLTQVARLFGLFTLFIREFPSIPVIMLMNYSEQCSRTAKSLTISE